MWNSLPESVVTAPSLHAFENRLDKHWRQHPLRWDPDEPEQHFPNPRYRDQPIYNRATELGIEADDVRLRPEIT